MDIIIQCLAQNAYKKKFINALLLLGFSLFSLQNITANDGTEKKNAQALIAEIKKILEPVQNETEVFSPSAMREKIQEIVKKEKKTDAIISKLSSTERSEITDEKSGINKTYKKAINTIVESCITADFKKNESTILEKTAPVVTTALAGAGTGMFLQIASNGINALTSLNTNDLTRRATENALSAIIQMGGETKISSPYATFISGAGASAITTKLSTGELPTAMGIITAGIVKEAFVVALEVVEKHGGVTGIANKINWRGLAIREQNSLAITTAANSIKPHMKALITNQTAASTLIQIGGKALQAGVIGGVFRLFLAGTGLVPADDIYADISAGIVEGAITGLVAAIGTQITGKEGGVITTSSQALTSIASSIAKGTHVIISPQNALQGIGLSAVQTIIPALVDRNLVITVTKSTGDVLKSRWLPTWNSLSGTVRYLADTVSDFVDTVQSMEPVSL